MDIRAVKTSSSSSRFQSRHSLDACQRSASCLKTPLLHNLNLHTVALQCEEVPLFGSSATVQLPSESGFMSSCIHQSCWLFFRTVELKKISLLLSTKSWYHLVKMLD